MAPCRPGQDVKYIQLLFFRRQGIVIMMNSVWSHLWEDTTNIQTEQSKRKGTGTDGLGNNYNLQGWREELKPVKTGNEVSDKVILGILFSKRSVLPGWLRSTDRSGSQSPFCPRNWQFVPTSFIVSFISSPLMKLPCYLLTPNKNAKRKTITHVNIYIHYMLI